MIKEKIEKIEVSDEVLARGGFADVRRGTYHDHPVAVKTVRVAPQANLQRIRNVSIEVDHPYAVLIIPSQRFCKEVILWSSLSHPNVSKLVGVYGDMWKGEFTTVSEWMVHGTIMDYIKNNRTNRLKLVRGVTSPATPSTKMRQ